MYIYTAGSYKILLVIYWAISSPGCSVSVYSDILMQYWIKTWHNMSCLCSVFIYDGLQILTVLLKKKKKKSEGYGAVC